MVATEKCFAACNPYISGAHRFFGRAKQVYFSIPADRRESMQDAKSFVQFWQGIVCNQAMPGPLQHYAAAILLACCSSCDAERSISLPNRIVTALRNRMSWKNIRLHLIGAEDINDVEYPYAQVASAWAAAAPRRYTKHKARKTPERKGSTSSSKRAKVLGEGGTDALAKLDDDSDFGSDCTSTSSFSSISISSGSSTVTSSSCDSVSD